MINVAPEMKGKRNKLENIAIYGAQGIALGTYNAIKETHPQWNVLCFIVTSMGSNNPTLGGLPVRELAEFSKSVAQEEKKKIKILISTPENVMPEIEKSLCEEGFSNTERIDSMVWAKLQEEAFRKSREFSPLSMYETGDEAANINVYMAKFWKDRKLSYEYDFPDYFAPVQAGAANTEVRVAEITDDSGDNISSKNGNYSELTVLYWMWKNVLSIDELIEKKYYGLAHYRRFLQLEESDLFRLSKNDIDVILPYPMPYEPDIEAHHNRYLSNGEWQAVLQAINEVQPDYAIVLNDVLKQPYFYNYNIVIAKGNVLEEYCAWLFPILKRIEEINDKSGTKVPNRYIGYVGETLETLYFMYNKSKLNIVHTGCRFLV